jgi:hypothetical protein
MRQPTVPNSGSPGADAGHDFNWRHANAQSDFAGQRARLPPEQSAWRLEGLIFEKSSTHRTEGREHQRPVRQVEYTHNGHTERGTGTVDGSTISFGNITIGTRDGTNAALEFSSGTAKMTAALTKTATPADQNKLVGDWIGSSATQSATFKVVSINGRDAQVQYTVNGKTGTGVGDLYKNTVNLGNVQVSSDDGVQGTMTFPVGHSTLTLHVTKFTPSTTSSSANGAGSSVNKLA